MQVYIGTGDISGASVRTLLSLEGLNFEPQGSLCAMLSEDVGTESIYRKRGDSDRLPAALECSTSDTHFLALNIAPGPDKALRAALVVGKHLSSKLPATASITLAASARLPAKDAPGSGPLAYPASSKLAAAGYPAAPADMQLHDPFLAALYLVLSSQGFHVSLLLVPGFKPSWRNEEEACLETAQQLGAALSKVTGRGFSLEGARGLEIAHRWYTESARDDQMYT